MRDAGLDPRQTGRELLVPHGRQAAAGLQSSEEDPGAFLAPCGEHLLLDDL